MSPFPKFAILDTGLDPECAKSKEFVKFVDFATTDNTTCRDDTGHGTSNFRLLRKVNPDVRVFVGRVWENNQATGDTAESTASLMTKVRSASPCEFTPFVVGYSTHNSAPSRPSATRWTSGMST